MTILISEVNVIRKNAIMLLIDQIIATIVSSGIILYFYLRPLALISTNLSINHPTLISQLM